jgi:hypothetical protein
MYQISKVTCSGYVHLEEEWPGGSVVAPHYVDADPDPTYHFDADLDPNFCSMQIRKRIMALIFI